MRHVLHPSLQKNDIEEVRPIDAEPGNDAAPRKALSLMVGNSRAASSHDLLAVKDEEVSGHPG